MIIKQKISGNCDRLNSSKCDRCILNLVRQYLMQADESTLKFHEEQQILKQFKQIVDQLGLTIVTSQGQVHYITQRGEQLLDRYFAASTPRSLPEPLQHWLKHQISSLTSNGRTFAKTCSSSLPLYIEQAGKQLIVRFISALSKEQYLLLLEEQQLQSFSVSSLELLGLTKREAEVLFWVAQDKSNLAIAKILNCSKGTVRKHLEHIHRKLGVQTRTAAIVTALERLGLLKESFVTNLS